MTNSFQLCFPENPLKFEFNFIINELHTKHETSLAHTALGILMVLYLSLKWSSDNFF